ncbi:MAG: HAD-IB family hydrolase [Spirochaetes bacterium]|nr:HAD-IB family hydrolase [Spirochaetota bacterium]
MNIALFDFDGTITNNDNFTNFYNYSSSLKRKLFITPLLFPVFILYKLNIMSPSKTRSIVSYLAFKGYSESKLKDKGAKYAKNEIPKYIRKRALDQINWHKQQGDIIVIVSASLNIYLDEWAFSNNFDLICTTLESVNSKITGRYISGDCTGNEKAKRIMDKYNLSFFRNVYAYGDTVEDAEMLNMGNFKYYRWENVS